MTHQAISLDAIDFSNPDGEFTFRGETYLLKKYLSIDFIRNKKHVSLEFICFLDDYVWLSTFYQGKGYTLDIEELLETAHTAIIYRCVQYKEALFGFGEIKDKYYSPKENEWISLKYINCKSRIDISLNEVFEKPYESFIERAAIAYTQELPLMEDDALFCSLINEEDGKIEFICGSQLELERLTKLAASTLSELQPLFEYSSSLTVTYESDNRYYSGGVTQVRTEDGNESTLSPPSKQLFNLIFEYNSFTGVNWEYNDGIPGYTGYEPRNCNIEVEVQAPSQHERLEAALELQGWLESKLPDDEIRAYIEG